MITTEFILMSAIIVFLLMLIGVILSVREFEKLVDESSEREARQRSAVPVHSQLHSGQRHR